MIDLRLAAFIAFAVYIVLRENVGAFIPSREASWLGGGILLLSVAITVAAIVWFYGFPPRMAPSGRTLMASVMQAMLLATFFFILHSALRDLLPGLLHRLAGPRPTTVVETVYTDDAGGRRCRYAAHLEGDRYLLRRRLCGLDEGEVQALRQDPRLQLVGTRSYFGIHVQRHSPLAGAVGEP